MLDCASPVEATLTAAERRFGWQLCIHDRTGLFADAEGESLLAPRRGSHRRFPACGHGMDGRCLRHCGAAIHARAAAETGAFHCRCWKGLRQVVAPIMVDGLYRALLTCGTWRETRVPAVLRTLPSAATTARAKLPPVQAANLDDLTPIIGAFAAGLPQFVGLENTAPGTRKSQIYRYLIANAHLPLRLCDLANDIGLSPSRTSHLVGECFGLSFQELLQRERLRRARALLSSTDLSVAVVGERVGYSDQYHFNRVFSREVGVSPGRYRRRPAL